jgi:hypothetical protein
MNERMNELHVMAARYAKEKYPNDIVEWAMCMSEKFAELIVQECANVADGYVQDGHIDIARLIKRHFGVAE